MRKKKKKRGYQLLLELIEIGFISQVHLGPVCDRHITPNIGKSHLLEAVTRMVGMIIRHIFKSLLYLSFAFLNDVINITTKL